MRAMILSSLGRLADNPTPLRAADLPDPTPADDELLIKIHSCAACVTPSSTRLKGECPRPRLPIVLGHQAVGRVAALGTLTTGFQLGDRVGVAWIYSACGQCDFCRAGEENLCASFMATGRDAAGGYAELMTVRGEFAHHIPDIFTDAEAAPLLCAGAIGYRSLCLAGLKDGQILGLTGFGASAHLVLKMVRERNPRSPVSSSPARSRNGLLPGNWVRPGLAISAIGLPSGFIPSSIRLPSGRRLSERSRISSPAAD